MNRAARLMALAHGGQIVTSEAVALLAREARLTDEAQLRDLGEHRLRDFSHVERVYQIDATGLLADFAPLRSLDSYATNRPSQLTSFVGRDDEIKALTTLVRAHRLVTLTGVGGVGKTRLALRVAAEVLPDARDGVWVCELAAADAEEAVLAIVTRALGVVPRPGMSARDSILDHLRGRDCVIVLDNSLLFAATYPARVDAIVLYETFVCYGGVPGHTDVWEPDAHREFTEFLVERYGTGESLLGFGTSRIEEPHVVSLWAQAERLSNSCSPTSSVPRNRPPRWAIAPGAR